MGRTALIRPPRKGKPQIIVMGQSTTDGRMSTLLRIRPTVMERVKRVAIGPMYLIIEHALLDMAARAEAGEEFLIYADEMAPGPEDKAMLEESRAQAASLEANVDTRPRAAPPKVKKVTAKAASKTASKRTAKA